MIVYNFDEDTGDLLFESEAMVSPLEPGKYLLGSNQTFIAPPAPVADKIAKFVPSSQSWSLVTDTAIRARARRLRLMMLRDSPELEKLRALQTLYVDCVIRGDTTGQTQIKNIYTNRYG
jgi:hypothetical protein